jgi:type II secretory pathway pseudopilin PulG
VELLVVIAIIAVLAGLLLPAMMIVRERMKRAQAATAVSRLHQALQAYAAEDPRHRYPTQAADLSLGWAPAEAPAARGVLNQLQDQGLEIDLPAVDRSTPPPFLLRDPWRRPYRYQADSDLLGVAGAQRPLGCDGVQPPLVAWNAAGTRPWGYVWSAGKDGTADGVGWIYQHDNR